MSPVEKRGRGTVGRHRIDPQRGLRGTPRWTPPARNGDLRRHGWTEECVRAVASHGWRLAGRDRPIIGPVGDNRCR